MQRLIPVTGFRRFTTDALPERDRLTIWGEMFARYVAKMQFAPVGPEPYSQNAVLRKLPGLSLVSASCTGFRATRTRQLIADGNDDMVLVVNVTGTSQYGQIGRETALGPDDGILLSNADEGSITYPGPSQHFFIGVPRRTIAAIVKFPEEIVGRLLPPTEELRLLAAYVRSAGAHLPRVRHGLCDTSAGFTGARYQPGLRRHRNRPKPRPARGAVCRHQDRHRKASRPKRSLPCATDSAPSGVAALHPETVRG